MSETRPDNPEVRYVPVEIVQQANAESEEIDLLDLIQTVWDGRWLAIKIIAVFSVLGLFIALTSIDEYTSDVKVLPESQQMSPLGSLGVLARPLGFCYGPMESKI